MEERISQLHLAAMNQSMGSLRVGSSVGHGQQEWAIMLQFEVLIGKLLAPDGLAASAL
jgi:hypothetical protein